MSQAVGYSDLDGLYPEEFALSLVRVCSPCDHTHIKDGHEVRCKKPGKCPIDKGWNTQATRRYANGADRESHLRSMVKHLNSGGNIGWAVPEGTLVLDADTPEAVAFLDRALPDAPMQESRPGRAHFVVRIPEDMEIAARTNGDPYCDL